MSLEQVRAAPRDDRRRCPLCFDDLGGADATRACGSCGTGYHAACFDELGGCATTGCARARVRPAPVAPRVEPQAAPPASQEEVAGITPVGALVGAALGAIAARGGDGLTLAFSVLAGAVLGLLGELFLPDRLRRAGGPLLAQRAGAFVGGALFGAILAVPPYAFLTGVLWLKSGSPIVMGTAATIVVASGLVAAWQDPER